MARPSKDSLSLAAVSIPIRVQPPSDLTPFQKKLWKDVVDTKPVDWFEKDTVPLLKAYCVACERLSKLSKHMNKLSVTHPDFSYYAKLEDGYIKTAKGLAVTMRLTQQSRYTPKSASTADKKAPPGKKPWSS